MHKEPTMEETQLFMLEAYLHKQLRSALEIRLSEADLEYHMEHSDDVVRLDYDEQTREVIMRHVQPKSDA